MRGALQVNGSGAGPVSAEWMIPKSLWMKREEPKVWQAATTICEYQVGHCLARPTSADGGANLVDGLLRMPFGPA